MIGCYRHSCICGCIGEHGDGSLGAVGGHSGNGGSESLVLLVANLSHVGGLGAEFFVVSILEVSPSVVCHVVSDSFGKACSLNPFLGFALGNGEVVTSNGELRVAAYLIETDSAVADVCTCVVGNHNISVIVNPTVLHCYSIVACGVERTAVHRNILYVPGVYTLENSVELTIFNYKVGNDIVDLVFTVMTDTLISIGCKTDIEGTVLESEISHFSTTVGR